MKDEIKEIKDCLKINEYLNLIKEDKNLSMGYVSLAQYINKLENCITNLQQENEDYKSRCENASKLIQNWESQNKIENLLSMISEVQRVLQGSDKE